MLQGLSQRNNTDRIIAVLDKNNNNHSLSQESDPDETVFGISFTRITPGEHREIKYFSRICKIEAMLADVVFILCLVPTQISPAESIEIVIA
jgi:hypothetical protein